MINFINDKESRIKPGCFARTEVPGPASLASPVGIDEQGYLQCFQVTTTFPVTDMHAVFIPFKGLCAEVRFVDVFA